MFDKLKAQIIANHLATNRAKVRALVFNKYKWGN